jgi:hypothetical protein
MLIAVMYYTILFADVCMMLSMWYTKILKDLSLDTVNNTLPEEYLLSI